MAFEEIECMGTSPVNISAASPTGVRVRVRSLNVRRKGLDERQPARWIEIVLGKSLASKLSLLGDMQGVRILFGTGDDAGKIALTPDTAGRFKAKRKKDGSYSLSVNAASAEGLFTLDFPLFAVPDVEVLAPPGKGKFAQFSVPAAMLAGD